MTLEVNRLCDIQGQVIGIGPRPGFPGIKTQISSIIRAAAGRPLVFIEDGIFTGGTMCSILNQFKAESVNAAAVVLGFAFPDSLGRLYEAVPKDRVHIIEEVNQPVDWMPDHDFCPYVPGCGRVVGTSVDGISINPVYDFTGAPYSIPYLQFFCPMDEWIGLKVRAQQLHRLSAFFLDSTIRIFQRLGELNGREIKFDDLRHSRPRVCIPCQVGGPLPEPPRLSIMERLMGERGQNRLLG
jgi:hypothetical protein